MTDLFSSRTHGRIGTYKAGCRCPECRAINAREKRRLRAGRRNPSARPDREDPMRWADRAACVDKPLDWFFPLYGGPDAYAWARQVCAGCPVRAECLEYAVRTNQNDGVWGGLTPDERHQIP